MGGYRLFAPILMVSMIVGCDLFISPQEKVVYDMYDAMCSSRSFEAMKPYLTAKSQGMLGLVKLALIMNGTLNEADAIAEQCSNGSVQIISVTTVKKGRYLMEVIPPGGEDSSKIIVLKEAGEWKVSLGGK